MTIWFVLWVFLTVFIIGLFGWSFFILLKQKRVWSEFAKKNGLSVYNSKLFASPSVTGIYNKFPFYLYSEEQVINASGGRRFRTIIQFELPAPLPASGIIASNEASDFARSLGLKESFEPAYDFWNKTIIVMTDNVEGLKPYLTIERCKSLNAMMTIKSIACIMIFDAQKTYLRFETADAFDNLQKLDRFVSKAAENAKILSI